MDTISANCFVISMAIFAISALVSMDKIYTLIACFISLNYFVTDFILMIFFYKKSYKIYFIHHSIGIIAICVCYFYYYDQLIWYLMSYLTFELSTPLLNWSLYNREKKINSVFSKIVDLAFILTFISVRIVFGTYLTVTIIPVIWNLSESIIYLFVILPILLQLMNFYWFYKIIRMVYRKRENIKRK